MDELSVSDEMRYGIAAQACLLVLNKDDAWYKNLKTILIYPDAFKSTQRQTDGYVETAREITRIGESWARGPVVLSWAHTREGAFIDDDGHNVVFHEFAHQLDDLSGDTDGAPVLKDRAKAEEWAQTFREAFKRLQEDLAANQATLIDPYGATSPAEFFAVCVEIFFERPADLKREEPNLYHQLSEYFRLDLA